MAGAVVQPLTLMFAADHSGPSARLARCLVGLFPYLRLLPNKLGGLGESFCFSLMGLKCARYNLSRPVAIFSFHGDFSEHLGTVSYLPPLTRKTEVDFLTKILASSEAIMLCTGVE